MSVLNIVRNLLLSLLLPTVCLILYAIYNTSTLDRQVKITAYTCSSTNISSSCQHHKAETAENSPSYMSSTKIRSSNTFQFQFTNSSSHQWNKTDYSFWYGTTKVNMGGSIPWNSNWTFFIGILSSTNMSKARNSIRATYLRKIPEYVCYRFILGFATDVSMQENQLHRDIVFIDQKERYKMMDSVLPYKTAAIINMAANIVKPTWTLKTDDDSYLYMKAILMTLPKLNKTRVYGRCLTNQTPNRSLGDKRTKKWVVSRAVWPHAKYPKFCRGGGYFMPLNAVTCAARLINSPQHKYFPLEDISVGILMEQCNITRTTLKGVDELHQSRSHLVVHRIRNITNFHLHVKH